MSRLSNQLSHQMIDVSPQWKNKDSLGTSIYWFKFIYSIFPSGKCNSSDNSLFETWFGILSWWLYVYIFLFSTKGTSKL